MISPELARVYASAPFDRRYIETLELSHPQFARTFRICKDTQAWDFLLDDAATAATFDPVAFNVTLPTQDGKGQQDMQIEIDNVGREAMDAIEAAATQPQINVACVYRVYLDQALSAPANTPPLVLALQHIGVNAQAIQATATRADTLNRPFPSELYRIDLFPGLDR